ncbi:uncharacterized protein G2W53_003563 [Senna tora]|uniref:Uncharacterized protein n=1 Tax=Senna tora TaxID=362788 RepID=A0A834XAU0_9FABA|nr:uncharacterized protein G2W53_003563 [Senna tora]
MDKTEVVNHNQGNMSSFFAR